MTGYDISNNTRNRRLFNLLCDHQNLCMKFSGFMSGFVLHAFKSHADTGTHHILEVVKNQEISR